MSIEQENNEMLRNQIREISHHSNEIKGIVNKRTRVEPWVVAKTERAATDLSDVTHYLDGERYADGGGLYDYKIGDFAWIRKADYNDVYGEIIDIRNFEMKVNLGQDIKGSQSEIYATIVDENGKEHSGQLMPKNYADGGNIEIGDEGVFDNEIVVVTRITSDGRVYIRRKDDSALLGKMPEQWVMPSDIMFKKTKKMSNGGSMYAGGGGVENLKYDFELNPTGDYDYEYQTEVDKINLLRKKIVFDQVKGNIDTGETDDNTNLRFYNNGKLVMTLKGDWNENTEKLDTTIDVDGTKYKLNYHPLDSMGGLDLEQLNKNIQKAFPKMTKSKKSITKSELKELLEKVGQIQFVSNGKNYSLSKSSFGKNPKYRLFEDGSFIGNDEYFGVATLKLPEIVNYTDIRFSTLTPLEYAQSVNDKSFEKYADGGGVSFTDYKGESIMFEPHFNEYYVGDAGPFSTMDEAKAHIDSGSPMSDSMRGAYERGLFAKGGKVGIGMMAWRGQEAYTVVGYDDSMDRWVFKSTTSGLEYMPKDQELKEFEFIKPKKMTEGGEIKVGDEFLNTERGEKFYIDKVDFSDKSYPFYVLKSSPNDYPEVIGRNEFERYYKAGLYEKYALGGGISSENAEKIAKLEKVLSSTLVPDSVKEKARLEIERLKSETTTLDSENKIDQIQEMIDQSKNWEAEVDKAIEIYAKPKNVDEEKAASAKLREIESLRYARNKNLYLFQNKPKDEKKDEVHDAILTDNEIEMPKGYNAIVIDSYYESIMGENNTVVAVKNPDNDIFYLSVNTETKIPIGKTFGGNPQTFGKTTASTSGLSAEQRDLNKKAIALVDKAKITDFKALVSEALTDANYHSEAFKFAQLVDSSIKTKEDWYQAEDFSGDDKTRDAGIQIANMCGWDGDKITEALYFVLKMKGGHRLADALTESFKIEKEKYLAQETIDYTDLSVFEELVRNSSSFQEAFDRVPTIKGIPLETARYFSEKYNPTGELSREEAFRKFYNEIKGISEAQKSIRSAVEPETKPSIRTAVVEIEKEQPKVSDDRLKGRHISDVAKYVSHRDIESITFTIDGKSHTVKGSDIFDGIYVENNAVGVKAKRTTKSKQPKVTRTQFEEETFEYGKGGYTIPNVKTTGVYEFAVKGGVYEVMVVGFERENETEDSLYFDDSNNTEKKELGSIIIKNSAWNKLSKGQSIMARSTTGFKGKLTRIKDLY